MKVLVAGDCYCAHHRQAPKVEAELVMMATCTECDPSQVMFIGLETGELYKTAVVSTRPDLDLSTYAATIKSCMRRFLHLEDAPRKAVRERARRDAAFMNEVANCYPDGTPTSRRNAFTLTAHVFKDDSVAS